MENILIITGEHDIPIAEITAKDMASYKVYFFDPTLVDMIQDSALRNAELVVWDACPDYPTLEQSAHAHAFALEQELDQSLRTMLPECSITAWQHFNLYCFFMAYHWYSGLWRDKQEKLKAGNLHVFLYDNPANFYWPSFLPALLLLEQLRTWNISFSAVTYGARPDESDVVMNLCDGNPCSERFDLLTHLPTCFYDISYFIAELQASGKTNINIEPKYWSVAMAATKNINVIRFKDQQTLSDGRPALDAMAKQLAEKLDSLLTPYIATPEFRIRQTIQLSNLYQSQLVSLHLLEQYFKQHKPGKMLLSDHDAGFHGPLISFAERHNIPVYLLPHSKVGHDCNFSYSNITVLTHPIHGGSPVNVVGKRLLHFSLSFPENFSGHCKMQPPLKKIGLLLNGLALNGVVFNGLMSYIDGIKQIDQWCKQHGIELSIRCRQGQTLAGILNQAIGIERGSIQAALAGSLQTFVQSIDLCLMYGAPTSASLEFLRTGVPILNPIPIPLGKAEAQWANTQVIPRASIEATLEMLDSFISDDNNLHVFCTNQFADYVSLFKQSYALRRFL
ncbi:MAG: hypothetical protein IPH35_12725 [Rhodoferax sp.]|nr:hypothetical protein [Rhodoferax sp.]